MSVNKSVPQLNALPSALTAADLFHVVRSNVDYKLTYTSLLSALNADLTFPVGISGLTTGVIPVATSATAIGNGYLSQAAGAVVISASKTFESATGEAVLDYGTGGNITLYTTNSTVSKGTITIAAAKNFSLSWTNGTFTGATGGIDILQAGYVSIGSTGDEIYLSSQSITVDTVPYIDSVGALVSSAVTSTELGYVSGVTSGIQSQINAIMSGISAYKDPVLVATTGNITLSGEQTLDGILTSGSRVLVWQQTNPVENGIYVSAAGAWTRSTDFDNNTDKIASSTVRTERGTLYEQHEFVCSSNAPVVVGTDSITFIDYGTTFIGTTNRITITGNVIDIAATYVGQTSITTLGTIGTGVWNAGAVTSSSTVTATTSVISPVLIGGSAVGSYIENRSTTGVGTTTALAHQFTGGTNGATVIASMYNDGQCLVGTTTRLPGALGIFRVGQGTSSISMGEISAGVGGIWINEATPSTTNYTLRTSSTSTTLSGGNVNISINGSTRIAITSTTQSFTPLAATSGAITPFTFTAPASTTQTASTEAIGWMYSLATDRQWAAGALTTQREFVINAPTYRFAGASTITNAATLTVTGAPIAGTNATITNSMAFWVQAGMTHLAGGLRVDSSVYNDGGAIKHARVTTGSVGAGSTALITITWATAFADANYTVNASVLEATTSSLSISVVHIESQTSSAVTVRVINNAVGSLTGTVHAIAMHD